MKKQKVPTSEANVAILVPSMGQWVSAFGTHLINLIMHSMVRRKRIMLVDLVSSLLPLSRDNLVEAALNVPDVTHMLFLDSDMTFPSNTLERLLAHRKPVVACNYAVKKVPPYPVTTYMDGSYVYTNEDSQGLESVGAIGMGVVLIERPVLDAIPRPRFLVGWREKQKSYVGEDIFFCNLLHAKGIPILIDHDLSKEVGHIGQFTWLNAYSGFTTPVVPPYDIGELSPEDTVKVWSPPESSPGEPFQT